MTLLACPVHVRLSHLSVVVKRADQYQDYEIPELSLGSHSNLSRQDRIEDMLRYVLPPLVREELRQEIERTLAPVQADIRRGLPERIISLVGRQLASLPSVRIGQRNVHHSTTSRGYGESSDVALSRNLATTTTTTIMNQNVPDARFVTGPELVSNTCIGAVDSEPRDSIIEDLGWALQAEYYDWDEASCPPS